MRYGGLDRTITIQRKVATQNMLGDEVITWQDLATVAAEKIEMPGNERYATAQLTGSALRTFRFRWSRALEEITTTHRIIFEGREFNITDVRETSGRRRGIEVDCFAPGEKALSNVGT